MGLVSNWMGLMNERTGKGSLFRNQPKSGPTAQTAEIYVANDFGNCLCMSGHMCKLSFRTSFDGCDWHDTTAKSSDPLAKNELARCYLFITTFYTACWDLSLLTVEEGLMGTAQLPRCPATFPSGESPWKRIRTKHCTRWSTSGHIVANLPLR